MANSSSFVLVSAHHCAPGMGSEHAVGWNLVSRLARKHRILLVTQDNEFRAPIEAAVAQLNADGCEVHVFFVRHGSSTDGRRNNLRLGYYLTYVAYQWRVYRLAKQLRRTYRIGLVHHLTIVGFREPGFLWRLGVPFVWGPVGGLVFTPRRLYAELSFKMRVFQEVRNWITWLQFHFRRRVRLAYRAAQRAGAFIAATPDIGERFQRRFGGAFDWIPETGSGEPTESSSLDQPVQGNAEPLKLLWVGGLLEIKPLGLLLNAIARVPNHQDTIELTVVGDGDSRSRFEALAHSLGVNARFVGWVDHRATAPYFRRADLFILFSMKDLTTNVVFEALGSGLPVLCLDHHGYSHIVDDTCGVKVPVADARTLPDHVACELVSIMNDRSRLTDLETGARARARQFSWDRNAERISHVYARLGA